tara:strand:+ start:5363 stop:6112 length:750 start_codon:yes stop_codon:yes gene_type:complete
MKKLEEVVREFYIEDLRLAQLDGRYPMFLQSAISGLKELNHDLKSITTEVILPVNANDTVDLPNNYIDYMVIGLVDGGKMSSLGLNNNMAKRTNDNCGDIEAVAENTSLEVGNGFNYGSNHFTEDGQYSGRSFGIGGGGNSNGTYKVYKQEGYIALNSVSATEIILKYLATIEQVDGNFLIEEFLVEALKSWMWYKYIRRAKGYGLGDKQMADIEYKKNKKTALLRSNRFSIPEFLNAYRSGYRSSPAI